MLVWNAGQDGQEVFAGCQEDSQRRQSVCEDTNAVRPPTKRCSSFGRAGMVVMPSFPDDAGESAGLLEMQLWDSI